MRPSIMHQNKALTTCAAAAFVAVSLASAPARATDCTTLTNPVYVVGSTAAGPIVDKISAYMATLGAPDNVTVVYGGTGSCSGVATATATVIDPANAALMTPSGSTNYFSYYDTSGSLQHCDILASDAGAPVLADVVLSDVFPSSCNPNYSNAGISEVTGPVQAMTFVVPASSTEYSISADAAYIVFGFGGKKPQVVSPWEAVTHMFQRGPSSGTQTMLAAAIAVPAAQWYGVIESGTSGMITALTTANAGNDSSAIGILGAPDLDPLRRSMGSSVPIRELAYKHFGQNCGYLPDSGPGAFDKKNVRDGHYDVWGPLHVLTFASTPSPTSSYAGAFVTYLVGAKQVGTLDVIATEAQAGLVPQCAMRVSRQTEVGPMMPMSPTSACGCYFEYAASLTKTNSCTPCQVAATDCPAGDTCPLFDVGGSTLGWCEAP